MKNLIVVTILASFLYCQDKAFKPIETDVLEQRIALVIGNAKYTSAPLRNPENDANDIAAVLRSLNFTVFSYINSNQRQMEEAILSFGELLNN